MILLFFLVFTNQKRKSNIYIYVYVFCRMCSEGFSFIVGVWDWTGVCVVLVMLSSSRRRGCVINFSPLGGAHALRFNPSLQNMKNKGSLARNARFGLLSHKMGDHFRVLDACQCKCIVVS